MSKKNNNKKNIARVVPLKIVISLFVLICVFIFVVFMINSANKATVYECTKYEQVVKTTSDDLTTDLLLTTYRTYTLSFQRNKKFTLEYKTEKDGKVYKYEGTYKKEDGKYLLTYDSYREEPSQVIYEIDGDKLVRDQYVDIKDVNGRSDFRGYIKQEFEKDN